MSLTNCGVLNSEGDYVWGTTDPPEYAQTTLICQVDNRVEPPYSDDTFVELDTSPIGTDTVSAATLYWYHGQYTKSAGCGYSRLIAMEGTNIFNDTGTPPATGWHSHDLTLTECGEINRGGITTFVFGVADPGGTYFRNWRIRAWDYPPTGTYSVYLAVTHAPPGGPTKVTIIGV